MKWYLLTGLAVLCLSGCVVKKTDRQVTVEQQDPAGSTWQGPGYYDGVWIQTEDEYNDRQNNRTLPRNQNPSMQQNQQTRPRPSRPQGSY